MRIVVLGPPGSGKGTQTRLLEERLGIPQISTGDMLRGALHQPNSLAKKIKTFITGGRLVPDEMVIEMMEGRLQAEDSQNGYMLDGFPRTLQQARALKSLLEKRHEKLNAVLNFVVSDDEVLRRLNGRRLCKKCGAGYHVVFSPSKQEGLCDKCGGLLVQRDDDKENTIRKRLKIYKEQTAPLVDFYEKENLLKNIKAQGSVQDISSEISIELGLK